jgi:hypothetical protein
MRSVKTGITDQTIIVHCFDADEAAVTLTSGSAALAISYRVDSAGREGTPVSMTPVARLSAGVHRDGAITSKGDGKHEIDLPDAAFASSGFVSVILTATAVTGRVYSEIIAIGQAVELDSAALLNSLGMELGNLDDQLAEIAVSQGLSAELQAQLDRIEAAAARIRGTAMNWTGNVGPGGVLELTLGDDHETVIENDLPISVRDPGGLLYAKLTAAGFTLQWSAGQDLTAGLITGTVSAVVHDAETEQTTITVQVPDCDANGNTLAPYTWQLQRTATSGKRARLLEGTLRLRQDMIGA